MTGLLISEEDGSESYINPPARRNSSGSGKPDRNVLNRRPYGGGEFVCRVPHSAPHQFPFSAREAQKGTEIRI